MAVLQLVKFNNRETIEALEWLAQQARLGFVTAFAGCYRDKHGNEQAAFTGVYRAQPEKAVAAGVRLSIAVDRMRDE